MKRPLSTGKQPKAGAAPRRWNNRSPPTGGDSRHYPNLQCYPPSRRPAQANPDLGRRRNSPARCHRPERRPDARPDILLLGALWDPRLRIGKIIPVEISREAGQVITVAPLLNEYGAGANRLEAVVNLQYAIADLSHSLAADKHRLGPGLETVWSALQEHIRPREQS